MKLKLMRSALDRRAARVYGFAIVALLAAAGCSDTTSPGQRAALEVTSNTLTVFVGGTGRIFYTVTNTTNNAVSWSTANASIATVDPTGIVSGIAPGTTTVSVALVANPSLKQDVIVTVTQPPVEVVLDSVLDGVTGVRVFNDSVRATFMAHFSVDNQPANSRLETSIDNAEFALCEMLPSGAQQINGAGAAPRRVVCPINTTQLDSVGARKGLPLFPNGAHTLNARVVAPAGNVLADLSKTLRFVNRDFLVATTNATGGDSLSARGAELTITVSVVRFTSDSTPLFATLTTSSNDSPTPVVFNEKAPTQLPATFTVDSVASAGAEGFYRLTPRVTDQGGGNRTGLFDMSRFLSGVVFDFTPPRLIAAEYPPGENTVEYPVLVLNHAAGIYGPGDVIALSRITAGSDSPAHPPTCTYRHLHGDISIQRQNSTLIEGPYTDPFTTSADPCGWGEIVVVADSVLRFNINGFVQERGLTGVTVALYMATGGCDAGPIVDDVLVPQGTGVGQTSQPVVAFPGTTGGFNAQFQMRVDDSFFGKVACTVVQASDKRVDLSGLPAPNTTYLVYASLIKGN